MSNAGRRSSDVLQALERAGFIDFTDGDRKALDRFPRRSARVLIATGTNSELNGSGSMLSLVQSVVAARVPTVVGEVYDVQGGAQPVPERGESVAPVRGDPTLRKEVSTVDDLELVPGQIAAVLALEQVASGTVGHYGFGQDADGLLPPHSS